MALSMEEQRILAEIEEHFTRAEPGLAERLSRLEQPRCSLAGLLRSPRGRLLASLAALATLVLMSMLVYLLISMRALPQRGIGGRPAASPQHQRVLVAPGPASSPHRRGGPAAAPPRTRATVAAGTPRVPRAPGGPARTRR